MLKTVRTKEELETARNEGVDEIVVVGELAESLKRAQKISKIGKVGLVGLTCALGAAAVTAPMTGCISFLALAPVAAVTGVEIAVIIAAVAIGISLVISLFKDYEEIECSRGILKLRKRQTNG